MAELPLVGQPAQDEEEKRREAVFHFDARNAQHLAAVAAWHLQRRGLSVTRQTTDTWFDRAFQAVGQCRQLAQSPQQLDTVLRTAAQSSQPIDSIERWAVILTERREEAARLRDGGTHSRQRQRAERRAAVKAGTAPPRRPS